MKGRSDSLPFCRGGTSHSSTCPGHDDQGDGDDDDAGGGGGDKLKSRRRSVAETRG